MELDELKLQLRQKLDEATPSKSEQAISTMLKSKAKSVIDKLQKSLRFEIVFCILFIVGFAYISIFSTHWSLRVYFSTFTVVIALFLVVLLLLLKRIKQLGNTSLPIKNNLQQIHSIVSIYVKRAFQFTIALVPICLAYSFWLGYEDKDDKIHFVEGVLSKFISSPKKVYLFLGVYAVLLTASAYYITKWYLKKLYGKYLVQLQDCINELDEATI